MKVVLINPSSNSPGNQGIVREGRIIFPPKEVSGHIGLGYLASSLRTNSISCQIIDADLFDLSLSETCKICVSNKPDLIGITLLHDTFPDGLALIKCLKEEVAVPIVVGGHLPTIAGSQLLNMFPEIDYAIVGEAEEAIVAFVMALSDINLNFQKVPNLIYRNNDGSIHENQIFAPPVLDVLPYPSRDHVEHIFRLQKKSGLPKALRILSSRGCQGRCHFCSINSFYKSFRKFGSWRSRTIEKVVEEISYLNQNYGTKLFYFSDDNFMGPINKAYERIKTFAQCIKIKGLDIRFSITCRIDGFSKGIFKMFKEVGLIHIGVGLENISNDALLIFNKGYLNDVVPNFVACIEEFDLSVSFFMILFHPFATIEEIFQNYLFLKNIGYFQNEIGKRDAYEHLLASRLLVRRFTPFEKILLKYNLHNGYMKKNPFIVKYKFLHEEVEIFWEDLFKRTNGKEDQTEEMFLDLINKYHKH